MSQNPSPENRPEQHSIPAQQPPQYAQPSGAAFEPAYPHQGGTYAYGNGSGQGPATDQTRRKRGKNVMGIIAFVLALIGFIFACIPGALIVGWILLPIAFLLSIISFFLKGKKGFSIAALIISVVGTIVGILVFFFVVASSFDEAFSDDVSAEAPAQEADNAVVEEGDDSAEEGTRENPYAIGTKISSDEWDMTITDVTLDATDEVLAADEFNEKPESGNQYMVIDVKLTYQGDEPGGSMPMSTVEYVSAGGNTFDGLDDLAIAPNALDEAETLYKGASTEGSIAIKIPSEDAESGVLAVSPDMFADKVFVKVK